MPTADSFYETDKAISEYLLFHYGAPELFLEHGEELRHALGFAQRCAALAWRHPVAKGRALDLGCAVGRSACELSAHFDECLGIDFSRGLVDAAERLRSGATLEAHIAEEGELTRTISLSLPSATRPDRLAFRQGDACSLPRDLGSFDFVLMANLIDRLPDPRRCLASIDAFLNPGGVLAITSPYTWLGEYTPKENWLGGFLQDGKPVRTYQSLQRLLAPEFEELEALNLPFLIREHARKNQYSVAHATLWRKR